MHEGPKFLRRDQVPENSDLGDQNFFSKNIGPGTKISVAEPCI